MKGNDRPGDSLPAFSTLGIEEIFRQHSSTIHVCLRSGKSVEIPVINSRVLGRHRVGPRASQGVGAVVQRADAGVSRDKIS